MRLYLLILLIFFFDFSWTPPAWMRTFKESMRVSENILREVWHPYERSLLKILKSTGQIMSELCRWGSKNFWTSQEFVWNVAYEARGFDEVYLLVLRFLRVLHAFFCTKDAVSSVADAWLEHKSHARWNTQYWGSVRACLALGFSLTFFSRSR